MDFISQRNENWAIPVDSPAYPPLPTVYKDVLFQTVFFRTDTQNVARLIPRPLKASRSGLCAAFGIRVKFSSGFGSFCEMGVVTEVLFRGKKGYFLPSLFLNSSDPISAGREIYGSPKKYANVTIDECGDEVTFTCSRAGIPMIRTNSRILEEVDAKDVPSLWPMYNLKMVPRIDKNEYLVKQLCLSAPPENVKTHMLFRGPGTVKFEPTVAGDFWKLTPQEMLGAYYQVMDYTQGFGQVVYEFTERKARR